MSGLLRAVVVNTQAYILAMTGLACMFIGGAFLVLDYLARRSRIDGLTERER